ncbi:hypothetical protein ZWY2020_011064 [Hordeum vulgare]|nr:hypothetical protein ZWY2020_011064 [Hordeum vulgare]
MSATTAMDCMALQTISAPHRRYPPRTRSSCERSNLLSGVLPRPPRRPRRRKFVAPQPPRSSPSLDSSLTPSPRLAPPLHLAQGATLPPPWLCLSRSPSRSRRRAGPSRLHPPPPCLCVRALQTRRASMRLASWSVSRCTALKTPVLAHRVQAPHRTSLITASHPCRFTAAATQPAARKTPWLRLCCAVHQRHRGQLHVPFHHLVNLTCGPGLPGNLLK